MDNVIQNRMKQLKYDSDLQYSRGSKRLLCFAAVGQTLDVQYVYW